MDTRKFSPAQKERFFNLIGEELSNDEEQDQRVLEDIRLIKERLGIEEANKKNGGSNPFSIWETEEQKDLLNEAFGEYTKSPKAKMIHNPKKVSDFLKLFKKNTDLKWTTHTWDNKKYNTIDDFINGLNNSREYSSLFKHNRDLYNLIKYFIYEPQTKLDSNGVPEYGWPNLYEMKFGWQYPNNLLINWCKENYDNKSVDERKKPFQYILPIELRPKKPVKGKEIKYFEDVVYVFKTEIQFREEYLYKELRKRNRSMVDFNFVGIEDAKALSLYTYTPGVLSAIDHILEQIKTNETASDVKFSFEEHEDKFIISICQVNSYPTAKELNPKNPKAFAGGHLNAIAESLFSLADFSVESKFNYKGKGHYGELLLTYDGAEGEMVRNNISLSNPPKFIPFNKSEKEVLGFTYKMTFYI